MLASLPLDRLLLPFAFISKRAYTESNQVIANFSIHGGLAVFYWWTRLNASDEKKFSRIVCRRSPMDGRLW